MRHSRSIRRILFITLGKETVIFPLNKLRVKEMYWVDFIEEKDTSFGEKPEYLVIRNGQNYTDISKGIQIY